MTTSISAFQESERIARELFDQLSRELPIRAGDLADARDRLVETAILAGDAAAASTLTLAMEAVEIRRTLDGSEGLNTSKALHNLGDVYYQRGEYPRALTMHDEGLAIRRKRLPPGNETEADSLERLALVQMRLEQFQAATMSLEGSLAIRERGQSLAPIAFAHALELTAWLHRYAGNYDLARRTLARSRSVQESGHPGGLEPVSSIELRGDLLMLEGDIADARAIWLDALQAALKRLGPDHPIVAALERRLAAAAGAMGNRQESIDHLTNGMRLAEARLASCDSERMALMDYAASSLMYEGQFIEARARYQAVLQSCRACLGETHANTATVISNLALLAVLMGDLNEAERLDRQAINVWSQSRPDHPFVAQGLDALAEVVAAQGRLDSARVLYARALRIRRSINKDHPNVAWTLTNLARVTADSGNRVLALQYLDRAMDIYQRAGPGQDPDHLARALLLRGELLTQSGDLTGARNSLADAMAARERFFGPLHPLTADARARLARADWTGGATDAALAGSLRAEEAGRDHMRSTVRYLPERHALA